MGPQPDVSICIPTFNDAATLPDALSSAIVQQGPTIEIVVLDNASDDDTARVVREFATRDSRIRYLRHRENLGMAGNFNAAIDRSVGRKIVVLCADDALEPGFAAQMAGAIDAHPEAAMAVCARWTCGERLEPRRLRRLRSWSSVVPGRQLIRECFAYGNRIGEPSAVMFRREFAAGGFDSRYNQALDLAMWFHLLAQGPVVVLPEPLCRIRAHPGQQSMRNIQTGRVLADKQLLFREFGPGLSPQLNTVEKLAWDLRMASTCARTPGGSTPEEVFHPALFRGVLAPAVRLGWAVRRLS